jgi:hypothetical protein
MLSAAKALSRSTRVAVAIGVATISTATVAPGQVVPPAADVAHAGGHYADVNGIKLYYELHGAGKPLVLLHGGLGAIEMFGANLSELA